MGPSARPATAVLIYAKWFNPSCLAQMCEGFLLLTVGQEEIDAARGLDPICFRIVVFLYSEEQTLPYQFAIEDLKSEKWCEEIARIVIHIGRGQIVSTICPTIHTLKPLGNGSHLS